MPPRVRDNSLGYGAYFADDAYVGFFRRVLIQIVDFLVLGFTGIVVWVVMVLLLYEPVGPFILTFVGIVWLYLAVLKQSSIRTVGFRLFRARIVDLRGARPSVLRMTFRLLLWLFGPFNFVYDLIWMGPDNDRRTLRDCFAGTCVVDKDATPVGSGEIHIVYYNAFGLSLMYPRVTRIGRS